MSSINKITGLIVGQYGTAVVLQIVDSEGNAVDISAFSGVTVRSISPDARTTLSWTGSLVNGGTDGELSFTPTNLNTFDRDGTWKSQVQLTVTGILALTVVFEMEVDRKI